MNNEMKKALSALLVVLTLVAACMPVLAEEVVEVEPEVVEVSEPVAVAEEAPVEEAPAAEEVAEEIVEEPFAGKVSVKLDNEGEIFYGDKIKLTAKIKGTNKPYVIRWEYLDPEKPEEWKPIGGASGTSYCFIADEVNTTYSYRAVLVEVEE